jgi:TM2 domain-containing membrane protein YozV
MREPGDAWRRSASGRRSLAPATVSGRAPLLLESPSGSRRPSVPPSRHGAVGAKEEEMAGRGSTGNVIAALASFFIPGLGQLLQGRVVMALLQFVLCGVLWFFLLGWAVHIWSTLDAALYKPR